MILEGFVKVTTSVHKVVNKVIRGISQLLNFVAKHDSMEEIHWSTLVRASNSETTVTVSFFQSRSRLLKR